MPSLVVDGAVTPILHVSQIATTLGLPLPPSHESTRLGWRLAAILDTWLERLQPLEWDVMTAPTESRGRSIRNLTVNTFHPIELLPGAWESCRFDWDPDRDAEREAELTSPVEVVEYAERIAGRWTSFLYDTEEALAQRDPAVTSPRGAVAYSELLASQAWHAGFHLDQIEAFLGST